jgi:hypothetical protein
MRKKLQNTHNSENQHQWIQEKDTNRYTVSERLMRNYTIHMAPTLRVIKKIP